MSIWFKTAIIVILGLTVATTALGWWLRYRKQWLMRQAVIASYAKQVPALIDMLDALHDCVDDSRVIEPFRKALRYCVKSLEHFGQLRDATAREAESVLALESQDKDAWLLLAKGSLREVEFYQQRFTIGLRALATLGSHVEADPELIKALKRALSQVGSRMKACTLLAMARMLEDEGKYPQALNFYRQGVQEVGRWRNPDGLLRQQLQLGREAVTRLQELLAAQSPLAAAMDAEGEEEFTDGVAQDGSSASVRHDEGHSSS